MQFNLKIELGNEAMQTYGDIAVALRRIAAEFSQTATQRPANDQHSIRDVNGNSVGFWELVR